MRTTGANTIDRSAIAESLGFSSWEEALPLLYRDHSISAIADLTGLCLRSVRLDMDKMGISARGRGGKNSKLRPESISGKARAAGVCPFRVHAWMNRRGYSLNQALEASR